MKIVAMVTAWLRPDVTRCCYRALSRVRLPPGWSLDVQVAGSEGVASRTMAEEFGFRYVEVSNRPLSRKHNLMLQATEDLSSLKGLLEPGTPEPLQAFEVERHVNSVAVDDARCLEPAKQVQLSLL